MSLPQPLCAAFLPLCGIEEISKMAGGESMSVTASSNLRHAAPAVDPLDRLTDALFHNMGSDGVYARTALYEDIVERLTAMITRHGEPKAEVMRFPPVM